MAAQGAVAIALPFHSSGELLDVLCEALDEEKRPDFSRGFQVRVK